MELARDTRMAAAAAVGDEWGVARRQAPFVEHKSHLSQIRTGAALAVFDVRLGGGLGGVAAGVGGGWRMGTVGCSTNRCSRLPLWGGDETPGAVRVPTASRCQPQSVGTEARSAWGCFASRRTRVNWPNFCHFCEADSKAVRLLIHLPKTRWTNDTGSFSRQKVLLRRRRCDFYFLQTAFCKRGGICPRQSHVQPSRFRILSFNWFLLLRRMSFLPCIIFNF